jgi:hypothetical protein
VIQLHSLAFGAFAEAEPLNPRFVPGRTKLRMTVDTDPTADVTDRRLLDLLLKTFPGIARHQCQAGEGLANASADGRGIVMLRHDPSANQAHLLEHVLLEMLSFIGHEQRLSGVTCAYDRPPQRNDIFVECDEPRVGAFLSLLALSTLNAALGGAVIAPLYADVTRVAGDVLETGRGRWTPSETAHRLRLAKERSAEALRVLEALGLLEGEEFAMNFSGEASYRFLGRIPGSELSSGTPAA